MASIRQRIADLKRELIQPAEPAKPKLFPVVWITEGTHFPLTLKYYRETRRVNMGPEETWIHYELRPEWEKLASEQAWRTTSG